VVAVPDEPLYAHDDADRVRLALLTLRRLTGVPIAFGGTVRAARDGTQVRLTELIGAHTDSLRDLAVVSGFGLGGKAIALARPLAVGDYRQSRTISHQYDTAVAAEGLRSVMAVPVVVTGGVRAVLYGAVRAPVPLGDRVIRSAMLAASELQHDLSVRDEARALLAAPPHPPATPVGTASWERVRAVHADLRALTHLVTDPALRDRLYDLSARLAAAATPDPDSPPPAGPPLSARELDVLSRIALGCTNAETATSLGLLPETVKSYLRSAMRKLGAHTRLEAVSAARRTAQLP
jgi:DNA-binding CsgD family transcriptional regulator